MTTEQKKNNRHLLGKSGKEFKRLSIYFTIFVSFLNNYEETDHI